MPSDSFVHESVMLAEVVDVFASVPPGTVLDATAGGAGHSQAILARHPQLSVVALDRDPDAVVAARRRLAPFGRRASVHHARFDRMDEILDQLELDRISGVLFDLGVSSPQLDRPDRGFSYRGDGPLDMRMDSTDTRTAADIVNTASVEELRDLLQRYGDERFAWRIAQAIVAERPITTTGRLAQVVADAVPAAARRQRHPARRTFQALRIEVNGELAILAPAIDSGLARLAPGGRCAVLAYHSGEDRIVKERFDRAATGGCTCPPQLPCVCGAVATVRLPSRRARRPSTGEVARNPRAESARLRVAERLAS